jgi:hypothetical protein
VAGDALESRGGVLQRRSNGILPPYLAPTLGICRVGSLPKVRCSRCGPLLALLVLLVIFVFFVPLLLVPRAAAAAATGSEWRRDHRRLAGESSAESLGELPFVLPLSLREETRARICTESRGEFRR